MEENKFLLNINSFQNPNALKLIVIPEYTEDATECYSLYKKIYPEADLFVIDWSGLYSLKGDLKFLDFFHLVEHQLQQLKWDLTNSIFIGNGLGASIANFYQQEFHPKGCVLINPIFSNNFVNPFTSNIPSYKADITSYYVRLKKEYYDFHRFFEEKNDPAFLNKYNHYLFHQDFYDTAIAQISLYESLKWLRKTEGNFNSHTVIFFGEFDQVVDFKSTIKSLKINRLPKDTPVVLFTNSAHHPAIEQFDIFAKELQKYVTLWS